MERRRFPRVHGGIQVEYAVSLDDDYFVAPDRDISQGGVSFACDHELPAETQLHLSFSGGKLEEPLRATGRVVRSWYAGMDLFVAVRFTEISTEDRRSLDRFLAGQAGADG